MHYHISQRAYVASLQGQIARTPTYKQRGRFHDEWNRRFRLSLKKRGSSECLSSEGWTYIGGAPQQTPEELTLKNNGELRITPKARSPRQILKHFRRIDQRCQELPKFEMPLPCRSIESLFALRMKKALPPQALLLRSPPQPGRCVWPLHVEASDREKKHDTTPRGAITRPIPWHHDRRPKLSTTLTLIHVPWAPGSE